MRHVVRKVVLPAWSVDVGERRACMIVRYAMCAYSVGYVHPPILLCENMLLLFATYTC